jgi:hypothetical protein
MVPKLTILLYFKTLKYSKRKALNNLWTLFSFTGNWDFDTNFTVQRKKIKKSLCNLDVTGPSKNLTN